MKYTFKKTVLNTILVSPDSRHSNKINLTHLHTESLSKHKTDYKELNPNN